MNTWLKQILCFLFVLIVNTQSYAEQKITFYHYDLLGSPVATTDEQGNVIWRERYEPWGKKTINQDADKDNVRGYTGHVHDRETGLTYMQARYYDPEIGRFMGIDPFGFKEDNPIMFNRYAYANNNPYKFTDPNGELPFLAAPLLGAIAKEALAEITGIPVGFSSLGRSLAKSTVTSYAKKSGLKQNPLAEAVSNTTKGKNAPSSKNISFSKQQQASHTWGTKSNQNRRAQNKEISSFFGKKSGEKITQITHERGTPVPGKPHVKEYDFKISTGFNSRGMQSKARSHEKPDGRVHGHPSGPTSNNRNSHSDKDDEF